MTPAETALIFAKECMGWDDAFIPTKEVFGSCFIFRGTCGDVFEYTDLNHVLPTVQEWCDKQGLSLHILYGLGNYDVTVCKKGGNGEAYENYLHHALLSACVMAEKDQDNG